MYAKASAKIQKKTQRISINIEKVSNKIKSRYPSMSNGL